jgi:hypothetical protein
MLELPPQFRFQQLASRGMRQAGYKDTPERKQRPGISGLLIVAQFFLFTVGSLACTPLLELAVILRGEKADPSSALGEFASYLTLFA